MFLRNAWYVAALGRELGEGPFARTILGEPMVFFRAGDGSPVALEDRCCHRQLPLSMGKVIGDELQCGYHGLRFDATGRCVAIPGQSAIPPDARVRCYPVAERWGWIWVWPGDPDAATEDSFPDWWWMDHAEWACTRPDPFHVACDYRLVTDNVLDTSHVAYVHPATIGASSIAEFPSRTERDGETVRMTRWILDRPPPPMYRDAGGFTGNVDRWQIVEHVPPVYSVNDAGCAVVGTGAPDGDRSAGITLKALSAPTPETERTTHYFFAFVRDFALDDPKIEAVFSRDFVGVFHEDLAVFEAQQLMLDRLPDAPSIDINVDAAPRAARRALEDRIQAERR